MLKPENSTSIQPIADFHIELPEDETTPQINPHAVTLPSLYGNRLPVWSNGGITGYHGGYSSWGAYGYMSGAMLFQQWGKMTLTTGANISKSMINGVGIVNSAGVDASMIYRFGRNTSATIFGGVNNSGFLGPSPSVTTAHYGGYVTLNTNNGKWGIDLGVTQVYNPATGAWETVPIAMPYYNLGGAKLGIDFGGLLHSASHATRDAHNMQFDPRRGPAVIAPPINMGPPKLAPVEVPKSMR